MFLVVLWGCDNFAPPVRFEGWGSGGQEFGKYAEFEYFCANYGAGWAVLHRRKRTMSVLFI